MRHSHASSVSSVLSPIPIYVIYRGMTSPCPIPFKPPYRCLLTLTFILASFSLISLFVAGCSMLITVEMFILYNKGNVIARSHLFCILFNSTLAIYDVFLLWILLLVGAFVTIIAEFFCIILWCAKEVLWVIMEDDCVSNEGGYLSCLCLASTIVPQYQIFGFKDLVFSIGIFCSNLKTMMHSRYMASLRRKNSSNHILRTVTTFNFFPLGSHLFILLKHQFG